MTDHIYIHVFRARAGDEQSKWLVDIKVKGVNLYHERCTRDYACAGDAITSARHAIKDLEKHGRKS